MPERRRLVLLDSDDRRRRVTATLLRLGGYSVAEGDRLAQERELAANGEDLLISEATLVDGDAVAYASARRNDPRARTVPVLVATTDHAAEARVVAALGELGYFAMPDRPSRLLDRVGLLLARPADITG